FDGKLGNQYAAFAASYNENKEKYGKAWADAQVLQKEANDLVKHIDMIKAKSIAATEGKEMTEVIAPGPFGTDTILDLKYVSAKDNYDVNTNLMIGAEPNNPLTTDN